MTEPDAVTTTHAPLFVYLQMVAVINSGLGRLSRDADSEADLIGQCIYQATRCGASGAECKNIRQYLLVPSSGLKLKLKVSEHELRSGMHRIYEVLCGAIGPIEADTLFAAALQRVEKSKAGRRFPPRRLM